MKFIATARLAPQQCQEHVVDVLFSSYYVFKPIVIESIYNISNTIPDSDG